MLQKMFVGDAGRLRQVLLNLTDNAVKFTEAGYVFIAISSESPLLFCVKDSGTGIIDGRFPARGNQPRIQFLLLFPTSVGADVGRLNFWVSNF